MPLTDLARSELSLIADARDRGDAMAPRLAANPEPPLAELYAVDFQRAVANLACLTDEQLASQAPEIVETMREAVCVAARVRAMTTPSVTELAGWDGRAA